MLRACLFVQARDSNSLANLDVIIHSPGGATGGRFLQAALARHRGDDLPAVETAVFDEDVEVFLPPTTTPAT